MVAEQKRRLQPLRINRAADSGRQRDRSVPDVPEPVRPRAMAPDWSSPTEGNGADLPRAELHIALITPDAETASALQHRLRVVKPPLWQGKVHLHLIPAPPDGWPVDPYIAQAMVDLGLIDSTDVGLAELDSVTIGYPAGAKP